MSECVCEREREKRERGVLTVLGLWASEPACDARPLGPHVVADPLVDLGVHPLHVVGRVAAWRAACMGLQAPFSMQQINTETEQGMAAVWNSVKRRNLWIKWSKSSPRQEYRARRRSCCPGRP